MANETDIRFENSRFRSSQYPNYGLRRVQADDPGNIPAAEPAASGTTTTTVADQGGATPIGPRTRVYAGQTYSDPSFGRVLTGVGALVPARRNNGRNHAVNGGNHSLTGPDVGGRSLGLARIQHRLGAEVGDQVARRPSHCSAYSRTG